MTVPAWAWLAILLGALGAGIVEYLARRRDPRRTFKVGTCQHCGEPVRLGDGFRVLAHNPPGQPAHRTCMGSYLLPVFGSVEDVQDPDA